MTLASVLSRGDSAPSLHQRILSDISEKILSGAWAPGHRIPFEHELTAEYNCSRMTVNKALSVFKKRGSAHERTIREFSLTSQGIQVGEVLRGFQGLLTGVSSGLQGLTASFFAPAKVRAAGRAPSRPLVPARPRAYYKWTDDSGVLHLASSPPPEGVVYSMIRALD